MSLGNALESGKLKGFWETTGRASLVINRIEKAGKMPDDLENVPADAMSLDVCDAETLPMEALLYQGGYLTIKDVVPAPRDADGQIVGNESYVLAPPNFEVRDALKRGYILMADCSDQGGERYNIYYDDQTQRTPIFEKNLINDGFQIIKWYESNETL